MANRPVGSAAKLANPFSEGIDGRKNQIRLFIDHQMIIAKMQAAHMPIEIFGFEVERENCRQEYD
jgi:hypothetical protein